MKIGLGTVQFGLDYGISNRYGKTPVDDVRDIVAFAAKSGIQVLDTAPAYGESERTLGNAAVASSPFRIVTKTPVLQKTSTWEEKLLNFSKTFSNSLQTLQVGSVYGLLVHHADDLLQEGGELLWSAMVRLKKQGFISKIGLSVYNGNQIDQALARFDIDLIQLPVNVFDQRLIQSGHLAMLKDKGVEVHARSAFLQGLLLMDTQALPAHFNSARSLLSSYHAKINANGLTPVQAALGFVAGLADIDVVICGVNNLQQLQELIKDYSPLTPTDWSSFACNDEEILNPSKWTGNG